MEKNELETKNIGLAHYLRNFVLDNKAYIMTLMYSTSKNYDLLLHDANKKLKVSIIYIYMKYIYRMEDWET